MLSQSIRIWYQQWTLMRKTQLSLSKNVSVSINRANIHTQSSKLLFSLASSSSSSPSSSSSASPTSTTTPLFLQRVDSYLSLPVHSSSTSMRLDRFIKQAISTQLPHIQLTQGVIESQIRKKNVFIGKNSTK
jgi:hypothetical protein